MGLLAVFFLPVQFLWWRCKFCSDYGFFGLKTLIFSLEGFFFFFCFYSVHFLCCKFFVFCFFLASLLFLFGFFPLPQTWVWVYILQMFFFFFIMSIFWSVFLIFGNKCRVKKSKQKIGYVNFFFFHLFWYCLSFFASVDFFWLVFTGWNDNGEKMNKCKYGEEHWGFFVCWFPNL